MTEEKTITLNGIDYDIDQVSEKAQYMVEQLKDLKIQQQQMRARLDQIDVCSRGFTQLLQTELENPTKDKDSSDQ